MCWLFGLEYLGASRRSSWVVADVRRVVACVVLGFNPPACPPGNAVDCLSQELDA